VVKRIYSASEAQPAINKVLTQPLRIGTRVGKRYVTIGSNEIHRSVLQTCAAHR
jgi:hypothetical protein